MTTGPPVETPWTWASLVTALRAVSGTVILAWAAWHHSETWNYNGGTYGGAGDAAGGADVARGGVSGASPAAMDGVRS